jgi:formate hydrogenlyase transcriptional activator
MLTHHFVQKFSNLSNRVIDRVPPETMASLVRYSWPGNIRELQNVIERAVIMSKGPTLAAIDLAPEFTSATGSAANRGLRQALDEMERTKILRALEQSNGVIAGPGGAAACLRIKRSTLQSRMQKLGIRLSRSAVSLSERNHCITAFSAFPHRSDVRVLRWPNP